MEKDQFSSNEAKNDDINKVKELKLLLDKTSEQFEDKVATIRAIQATQDDRISAAIRKLISDD